MGFDKVKSDGRQAAPFVLDIVSTDGPRQILASAVIDASGTWSTPNPLGSNGLPVPGELELKDRIDFGMPKVLGTARARYAGKRVLVVGAGHSALGTLLSLAKLSEEHPGTTIAACMEPLLSSLDSETQQVLRWADIDDWSMQRIADELGMPLSSAKSRVQRSRRKLLARAS